MNKISKLPGEAALMGGISYWQRRGGAKIGPHTAPGSRSDAPAPSRHAVPTEADYVIAGGGFAGISAALALADAEPGASIVLLEANVLGFGASGRNGGLLSPLPAPVWLLTAPQSPEHAWGLGELNRRVHGLARKLTTDLGGAAESTGLSASVLRMQSLGMLTELGLARVAGTIERCGVPVARRKGTAGRLAVELKTHTLDPYATVAALGTYARSRGIAIFEQIPVSAIEETAVGVRISLSGGGSIEARRAIVATNAYSSSIALPGKIPAKVVWNFMLAAPLAAAPNAPPDDIAARTPTSTRFLVELNTSYVFYRIHDGNVVYGGIERFKPYGSDDFSVPPDVSTGLKKLLDNSFPRANLTPHEFWSGRYHQTSTDLPLLMRLGANGRIVLNAGYGGTGVAMSMICAPLAAALARDGRFATDDDERLYRAISGTALPLGGITRLVTGVASDVVMRRKPKMDD